MANVFCSFDAPAVLGVYTATITAYDAATTYTLTINGKTVSTVGTGGTTTTTATALAALAAASLEPEFLELTWTSNGAIITGTANEGTVAAGTVYGKTHTITSSVAGGTGTFGAVATGTSPSGKSAVIANNFRVVSTLTRGLPGASDAVGIENSDVDLLYGLSALSAVTLGSVAVKANYSGKIGLPFVNESEDVPYNEYRAKYFLAGISNLYIGRGDGDGSSRLMFDLSSVQSNVFVFKTASPESDDLYSLIIKGTHASNTLQIRGEATCDIAPFHAESATFSVIHANESSKVRIGAGTTITTINAYGSAEVHHYATGGATTINVYDKATVNIYLGAGATATVNIYGDGATVNNYSAGTITTLNLYDGAIFNANECTTPFTVTTLTGAGTPTIKDINGRMTVTNAITGNNSSPLAWDWQLRPGRTLTLGAA